MKNAIVGVVAALLVAGTVGSALAVSPGAAVKNENANANAGWGQDRAYYASQGYFPDNMDIKQSFPSGNISDQLHAWKETYTEPHGPQD
jgi:hypothetical protein